MAQNENKRGNNRTDQTSDWNKAESNTEQQGGASRSEEADSQDR